MNIITKQENTADPDRTEAERDGQNAAKSRADSKDENHAEIGKRLGEDFFIPHMKIGAECFHAGAQIADTHGAGIRMTTDLVEGLYLKRTYKRNERVGKRFDRIRQETDHKQQKDLAKQDDLSPVELFVAF